MKTTTKAANKGVGGKSSRNAYGSKTAPVPQMITLLNLDTRYKRGDVRIDHNAADEPNPNVTISRPVAVAAYDRLRRRNEISKEQHMAAERYAMLREAELGAEWKPGEIVVRDPSPGQKGYPTETQAQASHALRKVHERIGRRARMILGWLVVDNVLVKNIAERLKINPQAAMGEVVAVLSLLAEHFGFEAPRHSRMRDGP